jgi:hypothetical protein
VGALSDDRFLQRTAFSPKKGEVSITANLGGLAQAGYPPHSATVDGPISVPGRTDLLQ